MVRKELSDQEGAYKWYNRGIALLKLGRFEEAVAEFDRVLTILPRYSDAWYNKGNALNRLGRYGEANGRAHV
jgi:tetratricopeptide (TPR) repeat protein